MDHSYSRKCYTITVVIIYIIFINKLMFRSPDKDNEDYCDVNLPELFQTFKLLQTKLSHCNIHQIISNAFINGLLANLPDPPPSVESLRLFVVIISYLQLIEYPKTLKILVTFIKVFLYIGDNVKSIIGNMRIPWWVSHDRFFFQLIGFSMAHRKCCSRGLRYVMTTFPAYSSINI